MTNPGALICVVMLCTCAMVVTALDTVFLRGLPLPTEVSNQDAGRNITTVDDLVLALKSIFAQLSTNFNATFN